MRSVCSLAPVPRAVQPTLRRKVEREIAVLKLVNHPALLRLYDVFETSKHLFLVLEHVQGGELFDYLVGKGRLPPEEALFFFRQIISGMRYCHSCLICHRDLKPENLLLDADMNIKIADFGFASLMKDGNMLETSCGSPHYASPEVVMGARYDGSQADIWSLGVILYALLTGKLPFDDSHIPRLLAKVKAGKFVLPNVLSDDVKDLISKMLVVDPEKRITLEEVIVHPWFLGDDNGAGFDDDTAVDASAYEPFSEEEQLDEEILATLGSLGWGDDEEITAALTSAEHNLEKVFYRLLEERKKQNDGLSSPRSGSRDEDSSYGSDSGGGGAVAIGGRRGSTSAAVLRHGSSPLSGNGSSGGGARSIPISSGGTASSPGDGQEEYGAVPGTPRFHRHPKMPGSNLHDAALSSSPKRSWFSSIFHSDKDKNGKGASQFGVHTFLSHPEIMSKLADTLNNLGIKWKLSNQNKIKAKYVSNTESQVKFKITVKQVADDGGHYINFLFRSGDIATYRTLYDFIQAELGIDHPSA